MATFTTSLLLGATTTALSAAMAMAAPATKVLPAFPASWAVHEDQYAEVEGSVVKWKGTVYNDQVNATRKFCTPPTRADHPRNCSATAYVDDAGEKSTYYFYEPNTPSRGVTYFLQPGTQSACFCDMVTQGRWIQCEIAESLCNPNMIKKGVVGGPTTFNGEPVVPIVWSESLILDTTSMRILVKENTAEPVQYTTKFFSGPTVYGKQLGYNQVNMTSFVAGRPDASVFDFGKKISGPCDDNICTAYAANVRAGMHPVAAFEGWE